MAPRSRKFLAGLTILTIMSFVGGVVLAQDPPPPEEPPTPEEPKEPDVELPLGKQAEISPAEMVQKSEEYLSKVREGLRRVVLLQEVARRQKDVIKLNCVNEKYLALKSLLNIAENAMTNLQEAIARNDDEGRYHEFSRMTIAYQQATVITAEAENCVGEPDIIYLGPTVIDVYAPDVPDDPTIDVDPGFPTIEWPPVASPFA